MNIYETPVCQVFPSALLNLPLQHFLGFRLLHSSCFLDEEMETQKF